MTPVVALSWPWLYLCHLNTSVLESEKVFENNNKCVLVWNSYQKWCRLKMELEMTPVVKTDDDNDR